MTKKEMIDVIEKSGMVINFSRSYFMGLLKSKVERFYNDAVAYMNRQGEIRMIKQYQVTLFCSTGKYRPESCIVKQEQDLDIDLSAFKPTREEIVKKALHRICVKHYWNGADLKRYGYMQIKVRAYDPEKIEAENKARYEAIKEAKYASGEWKRPKGANHES